MLVVSVLIELLKSANIALRSKIKFWTEIKPKKSKQKLENIYIVSRAQKLVIMGLNLILPCPNYTKLYSTCNGNSHKILKLKHIVGSVHILWI